MPKRKRDVDHPDVKDSAPLKSSISSTAGLDGFSITTPSGKPATLAIVDQDGNVVEAGPEVSRAVWKVSMLSYRMFLTGRAHLRVKTIPPDHD
ncbi:MULTISPECIES: hypothetical protein [unclassified Burkholderia]|uniref:hypothetical protein n=1 Tax=unclassified Burkholderia TaxID=2613784 RepID=UPI002ABE8268|nr:MULTISPECIES: hypothetical protein [unclassified Burkholderia]